MKVSAMILIKMYDFWILVYSSMSYNMVLKTWNGDVEGKMVLIIVES